MITRCPQCRAWFRVRAEHLSVANGYVTCGDCDAVFNALQTLVDESSPPPAAVLPPAAAMLPAAGPGSAATVPLVAAPGDEGSDAADASAAGSTSVPAVPDGSSGSVPDDAAPGGSDAAAREIAGVDVTPQTTTPDPQIPPPDRDPSRPAAENLLAAVAVPTIRVPEEPLPADLLSAEPRSAEARPAEPRSAEPRPEELSSDEPRSDEPGSDEPGIAGPGAEESGPERSRNEEPRPAAASDPGAAMRAAPDDDLFAAEFDDTPSLEPAPPAADDPATHAPADDPADTGPPPPGPTLSADEHAILFTEPGGDDDEDEIEDTVPEYDPAKAPPVLQSDIARLAARRRTPLGAVWRIAVFALLVAALAQIAWVWREPLVQALPAAQPVVEYLCESLDCGADAAAGTDAIRLLARDVREHPQYREALLVNATLVNTAATPRPYPVIELSLHDAVGSVLGARRFAPREYLDESIAIEDGMPPDRPVYVVMELGADALAAISFEFTFL